VDRRDPRVDKYILDVCQLYYWRSIEIIKLENLKDINNDNIISNILKISYAYENTRLPTMVRTKNIDDILEDYKKSSNIIKAKNLNKNITKETFYNTYINIFGSLKIKYIIMIEEEKLAIPITYKKNKYGYYENIFLFLPLDEIETLKKDPYFDNFEKINMEYYNNLEAFRTLRCDTKRCYTSHMSSRTLYDLAYKYNQIEKIFNDKFYIKIPNNLYLLRIDTVDDIEDWLYRPFKIDENLKFNCSITKLKNKFIPNRLSLEDVRYLLNRFFHDYTSSHVRRFLKYVFDLVKNGVLLNELNELIKNYINREEDPILRDKVISTFPFLKLLMGEHIYHMYSYFIILDDPINYYNKLKNTLKDTDPLYTKCILNILKKKI